MAVFQAARARTSTVPRRDTRVASLASRDRTRPFVRPRLIADATKAVPRVRPAAVLVVGVLLAAMLGFAYLTQTLTSMTTAVAIEKLQTEQERLYQIGPDARGSRARRWGGDARQGPRCRPRARRAQQAHRPVGPLIRHAGSDRPPVADDRPHRRLLVPRRRDRAPPRPMAGRGGREPACQGRTGDAQAG